MQLHFFVQTLVFPSSFPRHEIHLSKTNFQILATSGYCLAGIQYPDQVTNKELSGEMNLKSSFV